MQLTPIKANMTELEIQGMRILFSYKTPVASFSPSTGLYYRTEKKWSKTTSRHISTWLVSHEQFHKLSYRPQEFFDNLLQGVKL